MKVSELFDKLIDKNKINFKQIDEKMNNWIGRFSKGIDKFILWQDNHYYYSLQKSVKSPGGKFEIVKTFNDMSLEEVKEWLSSAGYKEEKKY